MCKETIYKHIYADAKSGGILWKNLPRAGANDGGVPVKRAVVCGPGCRPVLAPDARNEFTELMKYGIIALGCTDWHITFFA